MATSLNVASIITILSARERSSIMILCQMAGSQRLSLLARGKERDFCKENAIVRHLVTGASGNQRNDKAGAEAGPTRFLTFNRK